MRPPPFSELETVKKLIVHTTIIQQLPILLGGESEKQLSRGEVRVIRIGRFTEYQYLIKHLASQHGCALVPDKELRQSS